MDEEYTKKAEEVGIAYANGMFSTFSKPNSQGKNFSWDKFPDMCGGIAKVSLFTVFSDDKWYALSEKEREDLEKLCYEITVKKAQELSEVHHEKK